MFGTKHNFTYNGDASNGVATPPLEAYEQVDLHGHIAATDDIYDVHTVGNGRCWELLPHFLHNFAALECSCAFRATFHATQS